MKNKTVNAFANPVRIKLLCCLSKDKKNVAQLMENCGLSQSAVSQHLTKLKNANLVKTERDGKFIYYSITNPKTTVIANLLKEFCKEGEK